MADLETVNFNYKRLMGTHALTMFECDRLYMKIHGDTNKFQSTHNRVIEGILGHSGRGQKISMAEDVKSPLKMKSPLVRRGRKIGDTPSLKGTEVKGDGPLVTGLDLGLVSIEDKYKTMTEEKPKGPSMLSGLMSGYKNESAKAEDESAKKGGRRDKR